MAFQTLIIPQIIFQTLRNRKVRIDLAEQTGDSQRDGGDRRSGGRPDDGEDRTLGDWRRKPAGDDRSSFGGNCFKFVKWHIFFKLFYVYSAYIILFISI